MSQKTQSTNSAKMNRRDLLSAGAALMGAAATGLAFEPSALAAEKKAAASAAHGGAGAAINYNPPVVTVEGGQLRGLRDGKTTYFLGIPYAEAERFELPKPVKPWQGIKNAQAWGPISPNPPSDSVSADELVFPHTYWIQNEHCQVLNIWTQNLSATAKKPVMVWMHGGGFTNGASMESPAYDGRNLSEFGDVVVVSLNHRLNIIGTLDLSAYGPEYAQSRYTGTADLVSALQWVHNNIANFGGDPGNVTIFGQSGGGSKVSRMMHMPAAKGLFHKVIAQSGGGEVMADMDTAALIKTQQQIAAATLANLKLTGNDIDKLKTMPYLDLLAAGQAALRTVSNGGRGGGWNVIPDDNYIMREFCDWSSDIPLMFGSVFSEMAGTLAKGTGKNDWSQQEVEKQLTDKYGEKKDAIAAAFKTSFPAKKVQDVLYFATPNIRALAAKAKAGHAPVFHYIFAWEYPANGGITAFHCSEIAFAFHNITEERLRIAIGNSPEAMALQDKVSTAWLNFAKTGSPTQPGLEFKPFTTADTQTMVFDTVSECRNLHLDKLLAVLPPQAPFGAPAPAAAPAAMPRG